MSAARYSACGIVWRQMGLTSVASVQMGIVPMGAIGCIPAHYRGAIHYCNCYRRVRKSRPLITAVGRLQSGTWSVRISERIARMPHTFSRRSSPKWATTSITLARTACCKKLKRQKWWGLNHEIPARCADFGFVRFCQQVGL